MRIPYAQAVFGQEEKDAVMRSMESNWLAAGKKVEEFESRVAQLFGKKYALATNSGSSANLLALSALGLPRGSEIITPACTFATTVSPIIQVGCVPIFVDSVIGRYTIDENLVEQAISRKTKAILVPQLIGGVCNMVRLREIADKHGLYLIDDSCDTLAPRYNGEPIAKYSDITTTSFYGSHIITTFGTGGMVMTDSKEVIDRLRSLTNWGRVGTDNEDFEERFNYRIDDIPYDAKFIYSNIGYNVKMTESQAAFGLTQLDRLEDFCYKRDRNHGMLSDYFKKYYKWFRLPYVIEGAITTWLAFPLIIREDAPFTRYDFLKHLDNNDIQVRVLFSGNITRHPAYKTLEYWNASSLTNADEIMKSGFLIGCHQGLTIEDMNYVMEVCEGFLAKL